MHRECERERESRATVMRRNEGGTKHSLKRVLGSRLSHGASGAGSCSVSSTLLTGYRHMSRGTRHTHDDIRHHHRRRRRS